MDTDSWLTRNKENFSKELNGFSNPPINEYNSMLSLIDNNGKIIDLGRGNGMLLKFLVTFSKHDLIPFGIDKKNQVIDIAKKKILSKFSNNFSVCFLRDYKFEQSPFDFIITNPFYYLTSLDKFTETCINNLAKDGKLIYWAHNDVLSKYNFQNLNQLDPISEFNMKFFSTNKTSFAVYKKDE